MREGGGGKGGEGRGVREGGGGKGGELHLFPQFFVFPNALYYLINFVS